MKTLLERGMIVRVVNEQLNGWTGTQRRGMGIQPPGAYNRKQQLPERIKQTARYSRPPYQRAS
jgi:hypothetical protein